MPRLAEALLGRSSLPILCFHNIGGNGVPRRVFADQMAWLASRGVKTLKLAELAAFLNGRPLEGPSVLLTFDDGFRDLKTTIAPILARHGFSCLAFIIANRIRPDDSPGEEGEIIAWRAHRDFLRSGDRSAWLSAKEIRELAASGVMEIGSHGNTHLMGPVSAPAEGNKSGHWTYEGYGDGEVPKLAPELAGPLWLADKGMLESDKEYFSRVRDDLIASRSRLSDLAQEKIDALAWPWGRWSETGVRAANEAGFKYIFTLGRAPVTPGCDPAHLPRVEARAAKGLDWFAMRVALYSRSTTARLYSGLRI